MQFPIDVILFYMRRYAAYSLSYHHLEEMMQERGVAVHHPRPTAERTGFCRCWNMTSKSTSASLVPAEDWMETDIQINGAWKYLYRAVDKQGQTVDFLLTARRNAAAAKRFFEKVTQHNTVRNGVRMDRSGANQAALKQLKKKREVLNSIRQVKYLNNIVE